MEVFVAREGAAGCRCYRAINIRRSTTRHGDVYARTILLARDTRKVTIRKTTGDPDIYPNGGGGVLGYVEFDEVVALLYHHPG